MTSTIKVNNIQNQCGANIANKCGSTVTLGASGDTITLACGASQTGFGRTGTVDWDTTAKTAGFTAVSGNGYFVNTTSGAITATLPATPSAGDIVAIADYAGTAATNNITIARNGSNINGSASDQLINKNNSGITLVYVDGTQGWKGTETSNLNDIETQPEYIVATGGTVTCCGDYKIHTFTSPGTFCVSAVGNPLGSISVDYLVVAGGGGAAGAHNVVKAGGGGAGGYRESSGAASGCYSRSPLGACVAALPVIAQGYPITVGAGGAGVTFPSPDTNSENASKGSNSVFNTITSTGGGQSGTYSNSGGQPGGSGGGRGTWSTPGAANTGSGNTPPVTPSQGFPGGCSSPYPTPGAGGGGGATVAGGVASPTTGGAGGAGATTSISGTPTSYAGGGGGGGTTTKGPGGTGGGGTGGRNNPATPTAAEAYGTSGTANTGGGGGGASSAAGSPTNHGDGGSGGSGIVIIRYKYQ